MNTVQLFWRTKTRTENLLPVWLQTKLSIEIELSHSTSEIFTFIKKNIDDVRNQINANWNNRHIVEDRIFSNNNIQVSIRQMYSLTFYTSDFKTNYTLYLYDIYWSRIVIYHMPWIVCLSMNLSLVLSYIPFCIDMKCTIIAIANMFY